MIAVLIVAAMLLGIPNVLHVWSSSQASNTLAPSGSGPSTQQAATIAEFPLPQNRSYPLGITTDPKGNVWFAEALAHRIVEFLPSNQTFLSFPIPTNSDLSMIWFLYFDSKGYLWFSDQNQPLIWRFYPQTGQFVNFSTGSPELKPLGLAFDSSKNQIWFTSTYTNQIGMFQIDQNENAVLSKVVELESIRGNNTGPSGIALDSQGHIFVSESFTGEITEYDQSTGNFLHIYQLSRSAQPVGIVVDSSTHLIWFTDHASSLFGYINETSSQVTYFATSLFRFSSGPQYNTTISLPYWIERSQTGYIWFDEHYGNRIARLDPQTMQLDEFQIPTTGAEPLRFAFDQSTGAVWFTEFSGNKIGRIYENSSLQSPTLVSSRSLSLSQNAQTFQVSIPPSLFNASFVSGSVSYDGYVNDNLSISYQAINASAVQVTINRGAVLQPGNYSLTFCPEIPLSNPGPKHCAIALLSVVSPGPVGLLGLGVYELYIIAIVIVGASLVVSLVYVRRWRR